MDLSASDSDTTGAFFSSKSPMFFRERIWLCNECNLKFQTNNKMSKSISKIEAKKRHMSLTSHVRERDRVHRKININTFIDSDKEDESFWEFLFAVHKIFCFFYPFLVCCVFLIKICNASLIPNIKAINSQCVSFYTQPNKHRDVLLPIHKFMGLCRPNPIFLTRSTFFEDVLGPKTNK